MTFRRSVVGCIREKFTSSCIASFYITAACTYIRSSRTTYHKKGLKKKSYKINEEYLCMYVSDFRYKVSPMCLYPHPHDPSYFLHFLILLKFLIYIIFIHRLGKNRIHISTLFFLFPSRILLPTHVEFGLYILYKSYGYLFKFI